MVDKPIEEKVDLVPELLDLPFEFKLRGLGEIASEFKGEQNAIRKINSAFGQQQINFETKNRRSGRYFLFKTIFTGTLSMSYLFNMSDRIKRLRFGKEKMMLDIYCFNDDGKYIKQEIVEINVIRFDFVTPSMGIDCVLAFDIMRPIDEDSFKELKHSIIYTADSIVEEHFNAVKTMIDGKYKEHAKEIEDILSYLLDTNVDSLYNGNYIETLDRYFSNPVIATMAKTYYKYVM